MTRFLWLGLLAAAGCASSVSATRDIDGPGVLDILADDPRFGTFLRLAEGSGYDRTLTGPGPYTVLAPTDAAFEALAPEVLEAASDAQIRELLAMHVLFEPLDARALAERERLEVRDDLLVTVRAKGGRLFVANAAVTESDIPASNGVIHTLDAVLRPPPVPQGRGPKGGPDAWWW